MRNWFKRFLNKRGWYNTKQVLELCESASYLNVTTGWPKVIAADRYFVLMTEDAERMGWQENQHVTLAELADALIEGDLYFRAKIAEGVTERPPIGYST